MLRAKLICNPTAGRGRAGRQLPAIQKQLTTLGMETAVAVTHTPAETTAVAAQAVEAGWPLIVAIGGDGTVQAVGQGMVDAQSSSQSTTPASYLGVIPVGTGNDFAKMLGQSKNWRTACDRLAHGQLRRVDVGCVNGRVFLNNVGIGFDAQVGIEAQKIRWLRGQAVYLAALARNMLLSYRTPHVTVQLDEREVQQSITLLTIGNGRCSGGSFWLTPHAQLDDGLFDICLVRGLSKLQMLALVPSAMKGTHITAEPVQMTRVRKLTVTSADPLPVHADGEILYQDANRLEVTLLPAALAVMA
ncbi:MAG: diacylglycerol kinase family lipid kinase [Caldilineaceae bacterium]|nr:diacylglycerol kinase family lipid kinase [Caldilineaceae bacterium]